MRSRVFFKLLMAFLVIIVVTTVTLDIAIRRAWEASLRNEIQTALTEKTRMFAARVQSDHDHPVEEIAREAERSANVRATVIQRDGKVLADSEADPERMENHATRPEFIAALQHNQTGVSTRWSHTIGIQFLYVAVPIPGGAVRLAYPLSSIQQATAAVRRTLLGASVIALAIAAILSGILAQLVARRLRRIELFAERIAQGDYTARVAESSSDEIAHVAAALDRTARRLEESFVALEASRKELESVLNGMQEPVIAVGADRKVRWANGPMRRLVKGEIRQGADLVESLRDPNVLAVVQRAIESGQSASVVATSLAPGRTFEVTAAPMSPPGAVVVLHDLTAIERVEKTRRDFIANVSHELRTPLTSVQGYAETLMDSLAPAAPQAREFLDVILKNARRMTRLTDDLLVLARVESGEQRFTFEPSSADRLLRDALAAMREMATATGSDLVIRESAGEQVVADAQAIQQVLTNLVDNALKYAPGRIELGASRRGEEIEFSVRDFGPGVASEHIPRLFERFYRVDKARSRESGGTGLGLAIVKHIVMAHGGAVRVESRVGHGTTFYFTLPQAAGMTAISQA